MAADYKWHGINPENPEGPQVEIVFPAGYTLALYKHAPVDYENLRAAKYVLDHTERIFYGVRTSFYPGGWCYTGRPMEWYIKERIEAPFPSNRIFAVYINPQMKVYECRAEFQADDDPLAPIDWQTRFGGLTWKRTS